MKNLVLNTEEYAWLHHEISRLWNHQKKQAETKESLKKQPLYLLYGELYKSFHEPIIQHEIRIIAMNRKRGRLLHMLVETQKKTLDERIIPGYEEKMRKEDPERIKGYLDRARTLSEGILAGIIKKVEEELL
jgi:hypothetical protein